MRPLDEHLERLRQGRRRWNAWRKAHPNEVPRLGGSSLDHADLRGFDLSGADLRSAWLRHAKLQRADLSTAYMHSARLDHADLSDAEIWGANLSQAVLYKAKLPRANLRATTLRRAVLIDADLTEANLMHVSMPLARVGGARLRGANVFGVAAWNLVGQPADQRGMVVYSPRDVGRSPREIAAEHPLPLTVEDLETAQLVHLLIDNPKIAQVLHNVNRRAVLVLGRFTAQRKRVLLRLKELLQRNDFVPLLFDFPGSPSRDLTETVACLAHLSCFVIADLTSPRSLPQELSVIAPYLPSVPIVPLLLEGQEPYAMFEHIQRYPWVLPIVRYRDPDHLAAIFRRRVLARGYAEAMRARREARAVLRSPAPRTTRWPPTIVIDWQRAPPGYR
jgi:uncharacterized protein YjbI with pentapeptide repeats